MTLLSAQVICLEPLAMNKFISLLPCLRVKSFVPPKYYASVIYKCSSDHLPVQITAWVLSVNYVFPLFILVSTPDWMPETLWIEKKVNDEQWIMNNKQKMSTLFHTPIPAWICVFLYISFLHQHSYAEKNIDWNKTNKKGQACSWIKSGTVFFCA